MMRALIDTDVVLDIFLKREPFVEAAASLWRANEQRQFDAYVAGITPINVFYIARKLKGMDTAREAVREMLSAFRVCPFDGRILNAAMGLPVRDYEDAVQHASATASQLDAIITRDVKDYTGATLPVFTAADFLKQLQAQT